ncbi:MAG: phospho-N-acetylmuramoyl-pentapeptide-transferase [Bacillota bacterium]|nr:MAG: phospho-N-acetylmuramoyl-pentapeptide-transferase [Bacillota bacterium]
MTPLELVALWGFVVAFLGVAIMGVPAVGLLTKLRFGQTVRSDGPSSHLFKSGTPTMGGLIFVPAIAAIAPVLTGADPRVLIALAVTVGHALLGLADDFIKVALHRPLGLKARYKLAGQSLLAVLLGWGATSYLDLGTAVAVPFTHFAVDLGVLYIPFVIFLVLGCANSVNLTDGADGLAAGSVLASSAAYGVVALSLGLGGLAVFGFVVAGACLGFLVHNHHPARVIMGDTGSLALGGALVSLAVLTRTELWLVIIGGLYLAEALSVIIQVTYFRRTRRRVFRMAPLHHHFEVSGWPETRVVVVFWLVNLGLAALGLWGVGLL